MGRAALQDMGWMALGTLVPGPQLGCLPLFPNALAYSLSSLAFSYIGDFFFLKERAIFLKINVIHDCTTKCNT